MFDIKNVLTNWKTSSAGLIPAILIGFNCYIEKRLPSTDELALIFGAFGLGISAKDGNVTGGTTTQPTVENVPTLVETGK